MEYDQAADDENNLPSSYRRDTVVLKTVKARFPLSRNTYVSITTLLGLIPVQRDHCEVKARVLVTISNPTKLLVEKLPCDSPMKDYQKFRNLSDYITTTSCMLSTPLKVICTNIHKKRNGTCEFAINKLVEIC